MGRRDRGDGLFLTDHYTPPLKDIYDSTTIAAIACTPASRSRPADAMVARGSHVILTEKDKVNRSEPDKNLGPGPRAPWGATHPPPSFRRRNVSAALSGQMIGFWGKTR